MILRDLIQNNFDEVSFLEKFNINLDDLMDSFWERIKEKEDQLMEEFGEQFEDEDSEV